MTQKLLIAAPLLAVAAAFAAAPLAAEEPLTVLGQQQLYQERVSFVGLDLTRWSGQQALRSRVRHASERVCIALEGPFGVSSFSAPGMLDTNITCSDLTYAAARPQIADAIRLAKSGQQMATGLTIRALAR